MALLSFIISWILLTILGFMWPFLRVYRRVYDFAVHALFKAFFFFRKTTPLPPVFNPALLLSATQLARAIRERKMTSVSVVRAYISRISDVNPLLNALAQEVFRDALQEAQRVDQRIRQGYSDGSLTPEELEEDQPFLGVPFTVKESIAVEGLAQTGGLISRRFTEAEEDADVVQLLRAAGAILLATTNVSELGLWWEAENRLYGKTSNPYDLNRTPGGSSGGEAALMCACGSPLSIAAGGSIALPAFFCGLFAHQPSPGVLSVVGVDIQEEPAGGSSGGVLAACALARHAEDLPAVLAVLAGDNAYKLALDRPVNLAKVQVYSVADDNGGVLTSPVCRELREAQDAIRKHFRTEHDIVVIKMRIAALRSSYAIWQEKMVEEYQGQPGVLHQLTDHTGEVKLWAEFVRAALGRANHTWPSLMQAGVEKACRRRGGAITWGEENNPRWRSLKAKIQRVLGTTGVLLYPSHPTLAPHFREPLAMPLNFVYSAVFAALGFPVTQVPLGLAANGLPLGIQVVGGQNMDRLTLAVAADLEKAFGGWICPAEIL